MQHSRKLSYWELKSFVKNIDFLIIGAGIVGYSTALHLRKRFPSSGILLVERGFLPSGASSKNAGFACFGSPTELYADLRHIPESTVWETVEWRWKGLLALRELIGDAAIDLRVHGSWDLITDPQSELYRGTLDSLSTFNRELEKITGEKAVFCEDPSVASKFGFNGVPTSFYNHLEGQIDTSGMNEAFYKKCVEADVRMLFGIEVHELFETPGGVTAITPHGEIKAKKAFICTNGFAGKFIPDEIILPARAQVLVTRPIANLRIRGTFHYQEGYYYFRNIDGRVLLGGGRNLDFEGETTTEPDVTDRIMNELHRLLREVILPDQPFEIEHTWAGIMGVGSTKQPIIRQLSESIACGVRMGGMGVAIGTLVGKQLSDMTKF